MPEPTINSVYGVHPAMKHMRAIADNLPTKTGKSLDDWIALVKSAGPTTTKERLAWLKSTHDLGRDTAMVIVEYAEGTADYHPEELVEAMFEGPKAGLKPLYDQLLALGLACGDDVSAAPCATYVPLMRKRQFAVIKPTTRTRIDLGLALAETPASGRLALAKNLGSDRITHRIGLSSLADLDAEAQRWLQTAYNLEGQAK